MTANLTIEFEDGTATTIQLIHVFEIDTTPPAKQAIEFRETNKGWVMTFTKPTFAGKKFRSMQVSKNV